MASEFNTQVEKTAGTSGERTFTPKVWMNGWFYRYEIKNDKGEVVKSHNIVRFQPPKPKLGGPAVPKEALNKVLFLVHRYEKGVETGLCRVPLSMETGVKHTHELHAVEIAVNGGSRSTEYDPENAELVGTVAFRTAGSGKRFLSGYFFPKVRDQRYACTLNERTKEDLANSMSANPGINPDQLSNYSLSFDPETTEAKMKKLDTFEPSSFSGDDLPREVQQAARSAAIQKAASTSVPERSGVDEEEIAY